MRVFYIMDPLCAWCHGANSTVRELREQFRGRVEFALLPAGMWIARNAHRQQPALIQFIREHDAAVARTTGAVFGAAYHRSLEDPARVLDSEPPSRAIVAAGRLAPDAVFAFAAGVQAARFRDGEDLNIAEPYVQVCDALGLGVGAFLEAWRSDEVAAATRTVFAEAAQHARVFPTLRLARPERASLIVEGFAPASVLSARLEQLLSEPRQTV